MPTLPCAVDRVLDARHFRARFRSPAGRRAGCRLLDTVGHCRTRATCPCHVLTIVPMHGQIREIGRPDPCITTNTAPASAGLGFDTGGAGTWTCQIGTGSDRNSHPASVLHVSDTDVPDRRYPQAGICKISPGMIDAPEHQFSLTDQCSGSID